jgi:4-hydroxybenzoate polyprenyltransferase
VKSRSPRGRLASSFRIALASLRTRQWLHFCVLPLAGLGGEGTYALFADPAELSRALAGAVIAAGCLGCAYGINAVAERRSDRSARKNPLVAAPGLAAPATACAIVAGALALGLALIVGPWALLACGLSLLCGVAYSVGLAAKQVPVLGLLLNTGIFAPLLAVLLRPGAVPPSWSHELAIFTLLLIQNQLIHELADRDEDRAAGARTTAQLLGPRGAVRVATLAGLAIPPVALGLAPTPGQWLLGSALAAVATVITADAGRDPARARVVHRRTACAGGALLWLCARLAE